MKEIIEQRMPTIIDDIIGGGADELAKVGDGTHFIHNRNGLIKTMVSGYEQTELRLIHRAIAKNKAKAQATYTENTAPIKADRIEGLKRLEDEYKRQCARIEAAYSEAMVSHDAELKESLAMADCVIPAVKQMLKEKRGEATKLMESGLERILAEALAVRETRKAA